jgi:hypothetical protein
MDNLGYQLQLAGIMNVVPENEVDITKFDAYINSSDDLGDFKSRFDYIAKLLDEYRNETATLPIPGESLCGSCSNITAENLYSEEGFMHSQCYWKLLASAEVSRCPLCVLLVEALGGNSIDNFDVAVKLIHPRRTDIQIRLLAKKEKPEDKRDTLEVSILNGPLIESGTLAILPATSKHPLG